MSENPEQKRKVGRPRKGENHKIAETFDYSPRHVRRALKELGADGIKDLGELKLLERRVTIAFRHLRGLREQHDLEVARRNVVPKDEVLRLGIKIGNLTEQAFADIVSRAPAEMAGSDETRIHGWLKRNAADAIIALRQAVMDLDRS